VVVEVRAQPPNNLLHLSGAAASVLRQSVTFMQQSVTFKETRLTWLKSPICGFAVAEAGNRAGAMRGLMPFVPSWVLGSFDHGVGSVEFVSFPNSRAFQNCNRSRRRQ
jgi:hypothetical protein